MRPKLFKTCFCLLLIVTQASSQRASQPNIILILADDIGFSIPAVNGGRTYSTPHIDSMARHGINFTHCEATPLCAPSRMMLLTGKYNFRNYSNWGYMNYTEKTLGNLMRDAGYVTGFFGKIQLEITDSAIHNWGFDTYTVFDLTEDTMADRRYKNPVLLDNGYRIPDSLMANKYGDDVLTQKLFGFIHSNRNRPFFAYYPMALAHGPYSPTPDDSAFASWDTNNRDTIFFPSMIKYMDKKIGQILDTLNASGLYKNTIVIFCGDNGTSSRVDDGNDSQGEKRSSTEGGTHVPLIAYWPGHILAGSKNDDLIDLTDFFPTFGQAAGVVKSNNYGILDGVSFYKRMLGEADTLKQQLFMHYDSHPGGASDFKRWVRDKSYKLYDYTGAVGGGKFYNIVIDPEETNPLRNANLTQQELDIKQVFETILDTTDTWPKGPVIDHPTANNITNHSATVSAKIISQGASLLIERGSTLSEKNHPFLQNGRMIDDTVGLGRFSHKRINLEAQKKYNYGLYAMNNNASNSTAYAMDSFYTLSNPPVKQAESFTVTANNCQVILRWKGAVFPRTDANNAGYLVVYSTGTPSILGRPNGHPPNEVITNGTKIPLLSTRLPDLPVDSAVVHGLSADSIYTFLLVPYTWDGLNNSTYNYLKKGALTVMRARQNLQFNSSSYSMPLYFADTGETVKTIPSKGNLTYFNSVNQNVDGTISNFHNLNTSTHSLPGKVAAGCSDTTSIMMIQAHASIIEHAGNESLPVIKPNPSKTAFRLILNSELAEKLVSTKVYDISGVLVYQFKGAAKTSYSFGNTFKPGTYIVNLNFQHLAQSYKIVKL